MKNVRCRSKNPAKCRFHAYLVANGEGTLEEFFGHKAKNTAEGIEQAKFFNEAMKDAPAYVHHTDIVEDLLRNSRIRIDAATGEKHCTIFRCGPVQVPATHGPEGELNTAADELRPDERAGRNTGIFASPTLYGVSRWVRGNSVAGDVDLRVRSITVNPDQVYVYRVDAWHEAIQTLLAAKGDTSAQSVKDALAIYWETGITLTQWHVRVQEEETVDPRNWEVLLPAEDVKKVSPVSFDRVIRWTFEDFEQEDIRKIAKSQKAYAKAKDSMAKG